MDDFRTASAAANTPVVPADFIALPLPEGFSAINGPFYGRRDGDGVAMGFLVEPRHCNPMGISHGGMLMTFADMTLAFTANWALGGRVFVPTISLNCDFLSGAKVGSWVEGRGRMLRATGNMVFTQGLITVGEEVVMRCSGINKRPKEANGFIDLKKILP